jgi:hypothetical protein
MTTGEFVVVPKEPTKTMLHAGEMALTCAGVNRSALLAYCAMVAAAPKDAHKPMTDIGKKELFKRKDKSVSWGAMEWYLQGIEDAERAYGIVGK